MTVNSSGVAILIRRVSQFRIVEEYYSPDNPAQVIGFLYMEKRVQLCNVYLKAGAEPHEIRLTMSWIQPFLQVSHFFHILGGDFNVDRGWDLSCPLAGSAISASILDVFEGAPIQVVPKAKPGPTWISPQGHFGSLDHVSITETAQFSAVVTTHTESVFPSKHFPICLRLQGIPAVEPPKTLHTIGHIPAPEVIPIQYVHNYPQLFYDLLKTRDPDTLDECYCHFSKTVVQTAACVFGQPTNSNSAPTLVASIQYRIDTFFATTLRMVETTQNSSGVWPAQE